MLQPIDGLNSLRPRQNGRRFADDIFKCIFVNENKWIPIKISVKFVPKRPINNIPALFQIMARCRLGDKPLSEPMMFSLPTHICVTRPQWVKSTSQIMSWWHQATSSYLNQCWPIPMKWWRCPFNTNNENRSLASCQLCRHWWHRIQCSYNNNLRCR